MSTINVWFACVSRSAERAAPGVREALAAAGCRLSEPDGMPADTPGIVLIDVVTVEAVRALQNLCRYGRRRVLALTTVDGGVPGDEAWRLLQSGAADVLDWAPARVADAVARLRRWTQVDEMVDAPDVAGRLIGRSCSWRMALRRVVEIARFTNAPVLLTGESGTGKELAARLVHDLDIRAQKGELVVVDCTTVVATLSGSEFFGHERGAFTGAVSSRDGAFARADRGTLFLDEVGELPLELQAELLRVVQEHTYKRVGGNTWLPTDFRLVCATNRDLAAEQAAGRFRRDLYYRIAAACVHLPPLRERPGDTLPLFEHFLAEARPGRPAPGLDPAVRDLLQRRDYPGNVRDLRQLALRVSNPHRGPRPVSVGDIPEEDRPVLGAAGHWAAGDLEVSVRRALASGKGLREVREEAADAAVRVALEECGGNLRQAARRLGVTDRALQLRRAGDRCAPEDEPAGAVADRPVASSA